MDDRLKYEPVIGLEVHVQLATKTKLFCSCKAEFGAEPNANTCPVCLGWPGSLPVLNEEALKLAIRAGLALNCQISGRLKFDRKNYFYPDLPKAYQISQFDQPVNGRGWIEIQGKPLNRNQKPETGNQKSQTVIESVPGTLRARFCEPGTEVPGTGSGTIRIGITRAHLEEDAGKLLHEGITDGSLVDYNRAGTPLLEIVSEPDIRSAEEAYAYLTTLKAILEYIEVSDCNMEEGSLRCDANVSVRPVGQEKFGTKTEIKNLNSFKAVQKAIEYEIERQIELIESGGKVSQETRLWNDNTGKTHLMRSKEEAHDYRYFPEPDLVPFSLSKELIESIRKTLPELPQARQGRFIRDFGLSDYDASVLVQDKKLADYFETCVNEKVSPKLVSNWIQSELLARLYEKGLMITRSPVSATSLAGLIRLIETNAISGKIAKEVLPEMFETGKSAEEIVKAKGLEQVTDTKLIEEACDKAMASNPKSVSDFKAGNTKAIGALVGQVMKFTQGKANPKLVNEILAKKLNA